ncbi:MAG: NTP transferase domain-containing protein, partial [bacterium]
YLVTALRAAPSIGEIIIVGNVDRLQAAFSATSRTRYLPAGTSLFENLMLGLNEFPDAARVLVCACDTPLITPDMIEDYLRRCADPSVDFFFPASEKSVVEKRFPGMKRTYARLKEGTFTGGNLMLVNPTAMKQCEPSARKVIALRKSVPRLVSQMGVGFLLKFAFHQLSIADAEAKARALLGIRVKAVVVPFPEMGADLDKLTDYLVFQNLIGA